MAQLESQVREAFLKYGTAEWAQEHLVPECEEWEREYKTNGYVGDVVPANWDNYIIIENAEVDDADAEIDNVVNNGINDDINEEDGDEEDGFALVDVEL
jgi:hypothetical protein